MLEVVCPDLSDGSAEGTLELPAAVGELHQRAHVGLAPATTHRALGAEI